MQPIKKVLVVTTALLFPTLAMAQTGNTDPLRIVSDPLYLPYAGQIFGSTEYVYGDSSQDIYDAAHARTATQRIDSNQITQTFRYGITNELSVFGDIGYDPSVTTKTTTAAGHTSASSEGWTDPEFGLTYRVLDQARGPVDWDLSASYSPDAFDARSESVSHDGSVARGGSAVDLSTRVGHVWNQFTLAGVFHANYADQRDIANRTTGNSEAVDSNWTYHLDLESQYRFTSRFSLNAGAGYQFAYDDDRLNTGTALMHNYHVNGTPELNASLNYDFVPNTVVGSLEYTHRFTGNETSTYPTIPANDSAARNRSEDLVGVNLRYVMP